MNILYSAITRIFGHPDPVGVQVGTKKECEVNTWRPPNSSTTRKTRKLRNKAAKVARKRNRR